MTLSQQTEGPPCRAHAPRAQVSHSENFVCLCFFVRKPDQYHNVKGVPFTVHSTHSRPIQLSMFKFRTSGLKGSCAPGSRPHLARRADSPHLRRSQPAKGAIVCPRRADHTSHTWSTQQPIALASLADDSTVRAREWAEHTAVLTAEQTGDSIWRLSRQILAATASLGVGCANQFTGTLGEG